MTAQNQTARALRLPDWLRIALVGRNPKVTLVRAAVLAVMCFVIFKFILLFIRAEGISMLPTCQDHSVHLMSRVAYLWHEPRRGDVVSIRFSRVATNTPAGIHQAAAWLKTPHLMLMKRIIGLPGETIAFVNGRVFINDEVLDEPYEKLACDWNQPPEKLGPDEYYVVGDNRTMPPEFHEHGVARRSQIIGKLLL